MKKIEKLFLALFMTLTMTAAVFLPAADVSAARPTVSADSKYFDFSSGCYVLTGNVRVEIGERIITADKAAVNLMTMEVLGEGHINLVSSEDDITFSGDSVSVVGREKTAFVTGNAVFRQGETVITSDSASYSWQSKEADFRHNVKLSLNGNQSVHETLTYHVINRAVINADPAL